MATSNQKPVKTVTIDYTDPAPGQSTQLEIINDPGGNVGEIQFNARGGVFGGSNSLVWNNTTGNLGVRGNVRVTGNIYSNIFGGPGNLKIIGGVSGDVLVTDGTGNLSWVNMQDAGGYGNTEVAEFLPTFEGELSAGNANLGNAVTANFFVGDGSFLTNVATDYGNSNVANYLPTYTGNLRGGNANLGNAVTANYFIGNGSLLTGLPASYANSNVANYLPTYTGNLHGGNVIATGTVYSTGILSNGAANINSNIVSTNYNTGALKVRGGLGVVGNVHSGGELHSGGNIIVGGHSLFVGTGADAIGLNNATLVAFHGGSDYVQAALKNSLSTGSADWVAYGDGGTETQGWADFGFTSTEFNDANYTITGSGDGYFFVNTYAGSYGGNLVIATGSDGTVRDIIFATGGFDTVDEFARFDDSTNLFHLTRTGSGIKFADGTTQTTAYTGGGGGGGYIIPYEVATFVANTAPGFGEIQFANNEGANSAPDVAQKLFINESPTNEQSMGTIFQQWTSNSYRGTLSLNNGSDSQATFNISNGGLYFNPEEYRGFYAGLNQIWIDDCSINQLIITNSPNVQYYNTDFLLEDDVFHAKNLGSGNTHVMLNVYGSSEYQPINPQYLWNLFTSFVDNVLYDGSTLRTNLDDAKSQFYNNTGNFRDTIPTKDLFQYFRFTQSSNGDYFGDAPTTSGVGGMGATLRIRVNPNNTYTVLGIANAGIGYTQGDNLFVAGTELGGASPANDLTLLINSVNGDGGVTAVSYLSGDGVYPWPTNYISDGSDDQYDSGNYINTNLASEISYANGVVQTTSADFGGGDYCVMYNQSFFCMITTGSTISDLFYSGNLGSDGDGFVRWTGLRSNQNVTPNNQVRYAYFDCEYLDGELTPTVGVTYNMNLDSAGINLDTYYAYYNNNNNDYYFGSNNTWRLESQQSLYVQSYNDMFIETRVNQRGIGESGPSINIRPSVGSPGQREINSQAGSGGSVYINGGDAGGNDEIESLGNNGGSVNIEGGMGTGSSSAGDVNIRGGVTESPTGIAGNVNITTYNGPNSHGRVSISTNDGNTRNWAFNADGSTIYPTLSVTRGDRTGTLTGQTLLFGDSTQSVIISTPNGTSDIWDSQRLIINPGAGSASTTGEGGDIYLYAGRGGDAGGSGGDIKVRGGLGPADGWGGYIDITGGEASGNGHGGYIEILGGQSANSVGGYVRIVGGQGTNGADANITGGTGSAGSGGNVNITGGTSSNGIPGYGNVTITSGASTWTFDNTGNLTLPSNDFTVNYANGTQVNIGGGGSGNTGNVTFNNQIVIGTGDDNGSGGLYLAQGPNSVANLQYLRVRAGDYPTHIHLDTGNNSAYDQYFGDDGKYLKLHADGNISIGVDYSPNVWTFDSFHDLTVPGNIKSITTGFSFTSNISEIFATTGNVTVQLADNVFPDVVTGQVTISDVVGMTEANGTWYFQATFSNTFQLYYDANLSSPVDGTGWPAYIDGGGLAVAAGYNNLSITGGNVSIVNNNNDTWTFDNSGNVTLPGSLVFPGTLAVLGAAASYVPVTNENGIPGGAGSQTVTGTVTSNPGINTIQPGWIVTGNNLTTTTKVTSVVETSPNFYTITTDSNEANPFTYNDVYTFSEAVYQTWNFANTGSLTFPRNSVANTDPYLRIIGGADPAIISEDDSLMGPANLDIVTNYTKFSGYNGSEIHIHADDGSIAGDANLVLTTNNSNTGNTLSWTFNTVGNLTLPTISTGEGTDEQAIVRSQRKIIPALHYSAAINGSTPTVVYTATSSGISSLKMTISMTHGGLGQEMFDISAMTAGANVMYIVSNRLNGTGQPDTTVSVDYNGSSILTVTLTVNSGATTSWVTYDSTEFGYQVD